jgi:CRISPR type III-A/MTUBE-associated protein Csm6
VSTILFSAVGDTDPIRNFRDGAMLHIVRHYQPDEIWLYLSQEMSAHQDADQRYTKAIDLLCGAGWSKEHVKLIPSDLTEAHKYDLLYPVFRGQLLSMKRKYENPWIILNVSSGTPAMKSALMVLSAYSEFEMTAIQVVSPEGGSNRNVPHEDASVEVQWELNQDNDPAAPNRCFEEESPHLATEMARNTVKQHVLAYGYVAALAVAEAHPELIPGDVVRVLQGCSQRVKLNRQGAIDGFVKTDLARLVGMGRDGLVFEYLQVLRLKLEHEEYSDFVTSITPAITHILIAFLESQGVSGWWEEDEQGRLVLSRTGAVQLGAEQSGKQAFLRNHNLVEIVGQTLPTAPELKSIRVISYFEGRLRNTQAHEIEPLTEARIKKLTSSQQVPHGIAPEKVLSELERLFLRSLSSTKRAEYDFDSYNTINKWIVDRLDSSPFGQSES